MQVITFWFVGETLELDSKALAQTVSNLLCPALALFIRDVVASEVERTVGVVRGSRHMLGAVVARGDNRRRQTKCARLVRDHAQRRHQPTIHTAEPSARFDRHAKIARIGRPIDWAFGDGEQGSSLKR